MRNKQVLGGHPRDTKAVLAPYSHNMRKTTFYAIFFHIAKSSLKKVLVTCLGSKPTNSSMLNKMLVLKILMEIRHMNEYEHFVHVWTPKWKCHLLFFQPFILTNLDLLNSILPKFLLSGMCNMPKMTNFGQFWKNLKLPYLSHFSS